MRSKPIVLIAFMEQDNLGIGYVGSVLHSHGFDVRILDFQLGPQKILEHLSQLDPLIVGFSIIFQHYINDFREMIQFLRKNGITCHFTAGGHYPSLRYKQLLNLIPELDSVVLFEGEITFLELVQALSEGLDWYRIPGLAIQQKGSALVNELRPLEADLDQFPPPIRQPLREFAYGKKFSTILAGRGCFYNCSFCSIHEFYSQPPGPIKRVRLPELVVREMELLNHQKDCSIFMFQDDDFPITYKRGAWLAEFLSLLDQTGLSKEVMWKINCRPDEIHPDSLAQMKTHGLFLVYLGIESGTNEGLRQMNKHLTVETSLNAAKHLKHLGVEFDYGFMLFDPESDFEKISDNLDFLDKLISDGSSPVTFCKMMPYAGTRVEEQLISQKRLIGEIGAEDYLFHDPRIDVLYDLMASAFSDWVGNHMGLLNLARWVRHFIMVYRHYFISTPEFEHLAALTKNTIAESNQVFTHIAREMIDVCQHESQESGNHKKTALYNEVQSLHENYCNTLENVIDKLNFLAQQPVSSIE